MRSVDPERDSPEVLADYLELLDPRFLGMTGTVPDIASVATVYGVYFEARQGRVDTGYVVDHTASLMVVDREGYLKLVIPPETAADRIAADLEYLP